jgi:hypothetical protein
MKKLTSAETIVLINHYKNLLAAEGIPTEVRNEHLGSVMGEIPFFETWPQLWVVNDLDYDHAMELIESVDAGCPTEPWMCKACGEQNEGQFSVCWKCNTPVE